VVAVVLCIRLGREHISAVGVVAMMVILGGVALVILGREKKP
jgi:drug/metabolite transporter (DMT)-like permease